MWGFERRFSGWVFIFFVKDGIRFLEMYDGL